MQTKQKRSKEIYSKIFLTNKTKNPEITKKEALIIFSYTYQDSKPELSPYKILNSFLESNDRENGIKKVAKYFFILMKALSCLTPFISEDEILYAGNKEKVNIEKPKEEEKQKEEEKIKMSESEGIMEFDLGELLIDDEK